MADYIQDSSMGSAIAVQGFVSTLASVIAIAVLFNYTKNMEFSEAIPIAAAIFLVLGTCSILMMNSQMEKK